jgi:hypothetical protein
LPEYIQKKKEKKQIIWGDWNINLLPENEHAQALETYWYHMI